MRKNTIDEGILNAIASHPKAIEFPLLFALLSLIFYVSLGLLSGIAKADSLIYPDITVGGGPFDSSNGIG